MEQTRFWRDPALGNIEMLHATYVTHAFAKHIHEGFVVGVVERGAEVFEYRHAKHTAPAGKIVLINPGEPHTGQAATPAGWTYRTMYPDVQLFQQAATQLARRERDIPFFKEAVITDNELAGLILKLHSSLENFSSELERESRMLWTFGKIIARYADDKPSVVLAKPEPMAVARVRDFLETQYFQNISLEQLADICNLSQFHLLRVFRQETGLPPHSYLMQVRIKKAKILLTKGLPLVEIASKTGFSDQSHFTKNFKRIVGVTPGTYQSPTIKL